MSDTTREWDAASYDKVANPHVRWGAGVVDRLQRTGVHTVLDAGCGTGRVTELLLERLPGARVIALDGSRQMLDGAARRLAGAIADGRLELVHGDLTRPLTIGPVDAVLSTATFHWIENHDELFATLAAVLAPGGQLVAQCGGAGNIATVTGALRRVGENWAGGTYFATPEDTAQRLADNGFVDIATWLQAEPTEFEPGPPFEEFLSTVVLGAHLERIRPDRHDAFVHAVATAMPKPEIDYVRLNIVARRAG